MSTAATNVGWSPSMEREMRREMLVALACIIGLVAGAIGVLAAAMWVLNPLPWKAIAVATMAFLVGVSLGSVSLGRSGRQDQGAYLLVVGVLVAVAGAGAALGNPVVLTAAQSVPVVLAGLLMRRRPVLTVAGVVTVLSLAQVAAYEFDFGLVALSGSDARAVDILVVLGLFVVLSLLASEYSNRFGSTLSQLEARARDAELHAAELESAKAEMERRAAELTAAKQEIEAKTQVSAGVASEIQAMAKELAATSYEQTSGASEQAAAMGQIVAAMEELSRAASQIAANSAQVSHQVSSALRVAQTGHEAVEETIAGLDRIRAEVRSVAEKNLTLGQKTQAIGEIIEVISEIADRTHLLALNAAIESAAAGEYGRRFSVVASQVKELASEAKSAAHQVRAAVAEIQRAANATVLAAEKSEADVEVGAGLGRGAGEAIAQIVDTVQEVASAAKEMLLATQQQQTASEQVVSTIRQIEQVTRQSADGSRQISNAVNQLLAAAERLQ